MPKVAFLTLLAIACAAAADPVADEINRLEQSAGAIDKEKLDPQLHDLIGIAKDRIALAKSTTDPLVRLYRLRDAMIVTETLTFVAAHPDENAKLEAFEALWKRERGRFDDHASAHNRLLHGALAQAARNRAGKLYHASLPYARVAQPWSGVYYLGEAAANQRFAEFIDSLSSDEAGVEARPALAALHSAADAIDRGMLEFFEGDPTNRAAIPVSAKMKELRELLSAGAVDGATLLLLETRLELSRRQGDTTDHAGRIARAPTAPDDSMETLWRALAASDEKSAPMIYADVLPMYEKVMRR
jgi:hypothetical protein